jgi:hypothetical protein
MRGEKDMQHSRRLLVVALFLAGSACGPIRPADLLDTIRGEQRKNVKKSTGIEADQCFTNVDLERFESAGQPSKVASGLKGSPAFRKLAEEVKKMPPGDRKALLDSARKISHPTWAEQGRITSDGSGQTEAGQRAELLIANAIVDALVELMGGDRPEVSNGN